MGGTTFKQRKNGLGRRRDGWETHIEEKKTLTTEENAGRVRNKYTQREILGKSETNHRGETQEKKG